MDGGATARAVGASVMATDAIERNLMGGHNSNSPQDDIFSLSNNFKPIAPKINRYMGGNSFGISDAAWDDGGSGGGSDRDSRSKGTYLGSFLFTASCLNAMEV